MYSRFNFLDYQCAKCDPLAIINLGAFLSGLKNLQTVLFYRRIMKNLSLVAFPLYSIFFYACVSASSVAHAQPDCSNLVGNWINLSSSTIFIKRVDEKDGSITGTYTLISGEEHALVGWVNKAAGNAASTVPVIAFSVRWGAIGSITSWTGYCVSGETPRLTTLWQVAQSASQYEWNHIVTNSDIFTPKWAEI